MDSQIENAGLCLLTPYLERYFQTLGLIKNKCFESKLNAFHAVRLLDFMATGWSTERTSENSLSYILCGLENDPIKFQLQEIDSLAIAESEQLLTSVIRNWE